MKPLGTAARGQPLNDMPLASVSLKGQEQVVVLPVLMKLASLPGLAHCMKERDYGVTLPFIFLGMSLWETALSWVGRPPPFSPSDFRPSQGIL